jgi:hypothetical protein
MDTLVTTQIGNPVNQMTMADKIVPTWTQIRPREMGGGMIPDAALLAAIGSFSAEGLRQLPISTPMLTLVELLTSPIRLGTAE